MNQPDDKGCIEKEYKLLNHFLSRLAELNLVNNYSNDDIDKLLRECMCYLISLNNLLTEVLKYDKMEEIELLFRDPANINFLNKLQRLLREIPRVDLILGLKLIKSSYLESMLVAIECKERNTIRLSREQRVIKKFESFYSSKLINKLVRNADNNLKNLFVKWLDSRKISILFLIIKKSSVRDISDGIYRIKEFLKKNLNKEVYYTKMFNNLTGEYKIMFLLYNI